MKWERTFVLSLVLLACARAVFADDTQSANFTIADSALPAGSEMKTSSSSYSLEENVLDLCTKETLSSSNYTAEGSIGIGASLVPEIQSITPANFSKFFVDQSPSFTVTAKDPDKDPKIEYQLLADKKVKIPFQSSNVLTYALSTADVGRHRLDFQVRDNSDGTVSEAQATYDFRRPVK